MFNPNSEKYKSPQSDGTHFHITAFIYISFVKRMKPEPAFIHLWLHNTTHQSYEIYTFLSQTAYCTYKTTHLISSKNNFWPLFKLRITNFLSFNISCQGPPTLLRELGFGLIHSFLSWASSHPNKCTTHQLTVLHDIIQISSIYFNCIQIYSPTKVSCTFIFFCSRCLIISLDFFLQFQLTVVELVSR